MKNFVPVLCLIWVAVGCGESSDLPSLHTVTGMVMLDGEPLGDATVTFSPPPGSGNSSSGVTNAGGMYELTYSRDNLGAVAALHRVTIVVGEGAEIVLPEGVDPDNISEAQMLKYASQQKNLPARYNTDSELEVTVDADNTTHDFALTSGGAAGLDF